MVQTLKEHIPGIEKDIIQFRMNNKNPDLRKLDEILKILEMNNVKYINKYNNLLNEMTLKHNEENININIVI